MNNISHNGHRERIRAQYIANGIDNMPDHNVLELLLSISIPRKDVKPIAYDLINRFGSLEKVFSAHPNELMQVSGVGEQTAVLISLVRDINRKINLNKNKSVTSLCSTSEACQYFERMLSDMDKECVAVTTVDNSNRVIRTHFVENGSVNFSKINKREIIELILRDNASGVFVAHNHPCSSPTPSAAAELAVPEQTEILFTLRYQQRRMTQNLRAMLESQRQRLDYLLLSSPLQRPELLTAEKKEALAALWEQLQRAEQALADEKKKELQQAAEHLQALSPLAVLGRGFSVVYGRDHQPLKSARDVERGERLEIILSDGTLLAKVEEKRDNNGNQQNDDL